MGNSLTRKHKIPAQNSKPKDIVDKENDNKIISKDKEIDDRPHIEPLLEFSIDSKSKFETKEDVQEYVAIISSHSELTSISLKGNTFSVEAAAAIAEALKNTPKLSKLDLSDCFTGRMKEQVHVAVESFCNVLNEHCQIKEIDFSDNAFGPIGAKAVAILLSKNVYLEKLILNNNGLGPEGGKIIAQAMIDLHKLLREQEKESKLCVIEIGRNRLENGSCALFSEALKLHKCLTEISFPQNGIRPEGIVTLSEGFSCNENLVKINMQDNTFTDVGSLSFALSLHKLDKIEHLNLGDCLLGNEGSVKCIEALASSGCPLKHLNMQYNELEDLDCLLKNLDKFRFLKLLMLNGNCFNPNGVKAEELRELLDKIDKKDILDSWSDMEYESEEEEEEENSDIDGETESKVIITPEIVESQQKDHTTLNQPLQEKVNANDLEKDLKKMDINKN